MGYWLKSLFGAALFLGAVALFNVELLSLLETGTCASGGPYVSARPCPEGTGTSIMLLVGAVFAGLIGAAIFAARGRRPGGGAVVPWSGGLLAWAIFFTSTGAVSLYAGITDESFGDDAALGAIIVGATFLLMGVPALAFWVWLISDRRSKTSAVDDRFAPSSPQEPLTTAVAAPRAAPAPAPAVDPDRGAGEDPIARLERLQRLRESGALTEAEFEAQKRRILGT